MASNGFVKIITHHCGYNGYAMLFSEQNSSLRMCNKIAACDACVMRLNVLAYSLELKDSVPP